MFDERAFYNPVFFKKMMSLNPATQKPEYTWVPDGDKYWRHRELGKWPESPKIFDDNCPVFGIKNEII